MDKNLIFIEHFQAAFKQKNYPCNKWIYFDFYKEISDPNYVSESIVLDELFAYIRLCRWFFPSLYLKVLAKLNTRSSVPKQVADVYI